MKISEVSSMLKIPKSMIRYYEEKEIINIPRDKIIIDILMRKLYRT